MSRKRILVVSDLHVGSIFALMPDEVYIEEKDTGRCNRIEANDIQRVLYKKWCEMLDTVGRVDALFVMGDTCDGVNYKSNGFELWTTNRHQQVTTAADLLSMIKVPKKKIFGVQGSFYHISENMSYDLAVINEIGGTFGTELSYEDNGVRIHLSHEIGWSGSPVGKATALQSEIAAAMLNRDYYGAFDLYIRGHRHEWQCLKNPWGHVMVVPGWKSRDAFGAKKGMKSSPGFCGYGTVQIENGSIMTDINSFTLKPEHIFKVVR